VYGLGAWLVISYPTFLAHLPKVGPKIQRSLLARFTGQRAAAAELQQVLGDLHTRREADPLIVTRHYSVAVRYTFYLPGHPTVYTAGKYLAKRSTTFDQWDDTRLDNPALYGRSLLLCSQGDVPWERGLIFDLPAEPLDDGKFSLARNYRGPRPDYPRASAAAE
jgi:hypothetical protein